MSHFAGYEELAVVLSLTAKSGASVEIKVHSDDDPMALARKYAPALSLKGEKGITKLYNAIRAKRDEAMEAHAQEKRKREEAEKEKEREAQRAQETDAFFDDMFGPPPTTAATAATTTITANNDNTNNGSNDGNTSDFDDFEATAPTDAFAPTATEITDSGFDDDFSPYDTNDAFEGGFSPSSTEEGQDFGREGSSSDGNIIMASTIGLEGVSDEASLISATDNFSPSASRDNADGDDSGMHIASSVTNSDAFAATTTADGDSDGDGDADADADGDTGQVEETDKTTASTTTTTSSSGTMNIQPVSMNTTPETSTPAKAHTTKRNSFAEQVLIHTGEDISLVETFSTASAHMLEDWELAMADEVSSTTETGNSYSSGRAHLYDPANSITAERRSPSLIGNLFKVSYLREEKEEEEKEMEEKEEVEKEVAEAVSPASLSLQNPSNMVAQQRAPNQSNAGDNNNTGVLSHSTVHTSTTATSSDNGDNKYAKWITKALRDDKQTAFARTLEDSINNPSPSGERSNYQGGHDDNGNGNYGYGGNSSSNSAPRQQPTRQYSSSGYNNTGDDSNRPYVRERGTSGNFNFNVHRKRHSLLLAGNSKTEREAVMTNMYNDGVSRIKRKEKNMEIMRREAKEKKDREEAESTFTPRIFTGKHKKSHARASIVGTPKASPRCTPKGSSDDLTVFVFSDEAIAASNNLHHAASGGDEGGQVGGKGKASRGHMSPMMTGEGSHSQYVHTDSRGHISSAKPFVGEETKFVHDVYDWLAHHAVKHSEVKNAARRNKILDEHNQKHPFKPLIGDHSASIAQKRRNAKLAKYAANGLIDAKSIHGPGGHPEFPHPGQSSSKYHSSKSSGGGKGYEENKSTGRDTHSTSNSARRGGTDGGGGLTLNDLASDAFPMDDSTIDVVDDEGKNDAGDGGDGSRGASPSPFDEFALIDGPHESAPNPFDGHALPHHDEIPSYSPSSYMEAHSAAASVNGDLEGAQPGALGNSNIDIKSLSPTKRANALFEYLYHGRLETEAARQEADKKHFNYSFQPKVSKYANSKGTIEDREGGSNGSNKVKTPDAFFNRMHKTPTHTISQHCAEDVTEIEKEMKRFVIPPEAQKELFARLTEHYPNIYADRAEERKEKELLRESKARKSAHSFQPLKTRDLAKRARERSISEVFDVLLASVKYMIQRQREGDDINVQQQEEKKADDLTDEHQRRQEETHKFHYKLNHGAKKERADATASEVAGEKHDMKHSVQDFAAHSIGGNGTGNALVDLVNSVDGESLLDTSLAQPRFLEPRALSESVEIVIREARPEALSRTEFIHRMEILIQSGAGPPINAILIAPQRPVRYKHSDDIEVEKHVTNGALKLKARKMTERLAANKARAHQADPMKYAREVANKKEMLEAYHEKKEQEGCTYQPVIHTSGTYRRKNGNSNKSYHEIVYQRKSKASRSVLRVKQEAEKKKRESNSGPPTATITNSSSTTGTGSKDGNHHHHHHAQHRLSAFDQRRATIQAQHQKEYSTSNAHSMSHVSPFHVRADHMAEDLDANVEASTSVHHEKTDYEQFLEYEKQQKETEEKLLESGSSDSEDDNADDKNHVGSSSTLVGTSKGDGSVNKSLFASVDDNTAALPTSTTMHTSITASTTSGYVKSNAKQTSADVASRIEEKLLEIGSRSSGHSTPTTSTFVSPIKDMNETQELITATTAASGGGGGGNDVNDDHQDIDHKIEEVTKMINSIKVPKRTSTVPGSRGADRGREPTRSTLSELDGYVNELKSAEEVVRQERSSSHR